MACLTGFHAIEEALRAAKGGAGTLYVAGKGPRIRKIEELAAKRRTPLRRVTRRELDAIAGEDNRGIAFEIEEAGGTTSLESFLDRLESETALVLLLDGITDPHNLGAVLRSSDQFAVDLVCLPERRSASDTAVVAKSSAGAVHHVPHIRVANLTRSAELLKERGFWIYAAAMGGTAIQRTDLGGRVAVVLGSEGSGVSANLARHCDAEVTIPARGRVDSFNVSVAAGIILYEIRRQQGW